MEVTNFLGLKCPQGTDNADISVISRNFKKIDNYLASLHYATNGEIPCYVVEGGQIEDVILAANATTSLDLDAPLLAMPGGYKCLLISVYITKTKTKNISTSCLGLKRINIRNNENTQQTVTLTPRWLVYKSKVIQPSAIMHMSEEVWNVSDVQTFNDEHMTTIAEVSTINGSYSE